MKRVKFYHDVEIKQILERLLCQQIGNFQQVCGKIRSKVVSVEKCLFFDQIKLVKLLKVLRK